MKLTEQEEEKFWSKVEMSDDCWIWKGWKNNKGYGKFDANKKKYYAHRIAWTLTHGEIPPGMLVCHECDNPICVKPEHLFIGTQSDNMKDCFKKGRSNRPKGEGQALSKLTEKQVLEIRSKYIPWKYSLEKLSKEYGVTNQSVHNAVSRKTWKHI